MLIGVQVTGGRIGGEVYAVCGAFWYFVLPFPFLNCTNLFILLFNSQPVTA